MELNQSAEKVHQMFGLIESWQQSGLNQQQYCKTHGLAYSKFHYWYKRYRQQQPGNSVGAGFKKIELSGPLEGAPSVAWLVVHCTDGKQFSFHQPLPADFIRQLMH
jgi:hypothetical protein